MSQQARLLTTNTTDYLLDGKKHLIIAGSMSYYRMFPEVWQDRLEKLLALGANTVEVYVPWNLHEPQKGEFEFSGLADLEGFLKASAEVGLDVLLRVGPYICGEWEFGGLPWWLLNEQDIELRCSDPTYLKHVDAWWEELIPRVLPYLSTRGGPVIAVQPENEYGYFGDDRGYMEHLRDKLRTLGVDVLLFTSDGVFTPETIANGGLPDVLKTANFGSKPEENLANLRKAQPEGPLTCMEFWVGWFDAWGNDTKSSRDAESAAADLKTMLEMNASVNFFTFCGGTSFGFMSGANDSDQYEPHVTSYDYDGLLTEAGDITPKYELCRSVIAEYTGRTDLTRTFKPAPTIAPGPVTIQATVSLTDALGSISTPVQSVKPKSIERLGHGYGYVMYRAQVPASFDGLPIRLRGMRDFAHVMLNGTSMGTWYINDDHPDWVFRCSGEHAQLDILVDCMARPNFGHRYKELKGISEGVFFGARRHDERAHFGWTSHALPMTNLDALPWGNEGNERRGPSFDRVLFQIEDTADTYLRLEGYEKGFAMINGFNLGRYWKIGPQHTLYVPKQVLREGENELIVFDAVGSEPGRPSFQSTPLFS